MAESPKRGESSGAAHTFICSYPGCAMTFSRNDRLIIHMRTHTGEKPFACAEFGCDKCYARAAHLKRHVETSHSEAKQQDRLKCTVEGCGQDFANSLSLSRHVERIHQPKEYKCHYEDCGKIFRKHHQLKCHEAECHTHISPYRCMVENCNKSFKTAGHLQRHQKVHEGYVCGEKNCGVRFEKWTQLWKHRTVAHRQDFKCDKCDKRFTQQCRLSQHLRTHQDTREVFECPREDCSRVYLELRNLKAHIRSYHDGQRHKCPVEDCQRTFASKQKLAQHSRLHDADRPPPKKKSRKGQKRKSMALKLAMLGLGEGDSTELIELDRKKLQTNRSIGGETGDKSGSWTASRIRADRGEAEGMLISCVTTASPAGANNTDSDRTDVRDEEWSGDDQTVAVTDEPADKPHGGLLSEARDEQVEYGENRIDGSMWGEKSQQSAGCTARLVTAEAGSLQSQTFGDFGLLSEVNEHAQTKVHIAGQFDVNSEQCLMESKQIFPLDSGSVEQREICRKECSVNKIDGISDSETGIQCEPTSCTRDQLETGESVREFRSSESKVSWNMDADSMLITSELSDQQHIVHVPLASPDSLSEHIRMVSANFHKETHQSDSVASGTCNHKDSEPLQLLNETSFPMKEKDEKEHNVVAPPRSSMHTAAT